MTTHRRALQILFAASLGMPGVVLCLAGFGAWDLSEKQSA
jgi:hypothetical protein